MTEFIHDYTGDFEPAAVGIYACRVDHTHLPGLHQDVFLVRRNDSWYYLSNGEYFRGAVYGWCGPIPRTR